MKFSFLRKPKSAIFSVVLLSWKTLFKGNILKTSITPQYCRLNLLLHGGHFVCEITIKHQNYNPPVYKAILHESSLILPDSDWCWCKEDIFYIIFSFWQNKTMQTTTKNAAIASYHRVTLIFPVKYFVVTLA